MLGRFTARYAADGAIPNMRIPRDVMAREPDAQFLPGRKSLSPVVTQIDSRPSPDHEAGLMGL
jgi:hypothetical protein